MNRMEVLHGGPSKAQSFGAILDDKGKKVIISFKDGKTTVIENNGGSPIEMICPSVQGEVLCCFLEDGGQRFFETATGLPLKRAANGKKARGHALRPQFYC